MNSASQVFQLALQYHQAGNLAQAEQVYRQILEANPQHADALHMLGVIALQLGRHELAVDQIQQALRFQPKFPAALSNLGMALHAQGKIEEAIENYRQALLFQPELSQAHNNLANALKDLGRFEEAVAGYQQALRLKPDDLQTYVNLGSALQALGTLDQAITCFRRALYYNSEFAAAYNHLGYALCEQEKYDEAIANFQEAARLKPDFTEVYINLGNALRNQWKLDEAIANYRQALRLRPEYVLAHTNLGSALKDQGRLDEAIASYRQALRLEPGYIAAHDNLIMTMHYHADYDAAALYQEARRWNDRHAEPLAKHRQPHANSVDPERRLRIGYVSPDFRANVLSNFTIPLLSNHDDRAVEVFCYAEIRAPDEVTDRLRKYADVWRSTVGLTDAQMADTVQNDRIDILVDLALHSANNRLPVFARKPAPVQVTWLGCPLTNGLSTIDYRLTDAYLDPPELDGPEKLIRLPDTFWCYAPYHAPSLTVSVNDLPALQNGYLTFGCLNNFCKVNDVSLSLWSKVLRALPDSRLMLLTPRDAAQGRVLAHLEGEGIAPSRVAIVHRQPSVLEYMLRYHAIDVCLDPVPFNGHTTSLDAFWMGVPTITLAGKTAVGRVGFSLLVNLGLPELAARTSNEYVAVAVKLAGDLAWLAQLRAGLRERMRASALMDGERFARRMEQVYRQVWRRWCEEQCAG
jgi:protein O-GlcNAc transferase